MCVCACSGNLTLSAASLLCEHESRDMQVPERAATAVHAGIGGGTRMWELQYGSVTRDYVDITLQVGLSRTSGGSGGPLKRLRKWRRVP